MSATADDAPRTICYTVTPQRFTLDIPVNALATLSRDDYARMLGVLNDWVLRYGPRQPAEGAAAPGLAVRINDAGTRFTLIDAQTFTEEGVTVPAGYQCDFASVPKIAWSFGFTPLGRHQRAALLHDYLYDIHHWRGVGTRADADAAFLRQMRRDGVGWRSRWTMYLAVRVCGWLYWNRPAR